MASHRSPVEHARAARRSRNQALADLSSGALEASKAVREPPEALLSVDLYDVLMRCQSLGRESVRQVCERAGVWPHMRMAELTDAQRAALVLALPARLR